MTRYGLSVADYYGDMLAMVELHMDGAPDAVARVARANHEGLSPEDASARREKDYRETLAVSLEAIRFLLAQRAADRGTTTRSELELLGLEIAAGDRERPAPPND